MKSSTSTMQSESRAISLSLAALRDLVRRVAMPTLQDIVGAGLCVGCGACEIVAGSDVVPLQWDEYGSYRPHVLRHLDSATQSRIRSVCPGLRVQLHREASHGKRAKSGRGTRSRFRCSVQGIFWRRAYCSGHPSPRDVRGFSDTACGTVGKSPPEDRSTHQPDQW